MNLDASYSDEVTDFGIQNLIFPPTIISNRGNSSHGIKVNLTNTRARTSQVAKVLQVSNKSEVFIYIKKKKTTLINVKYYCELQTFQVINIRGTEVTVIGCVILLQFAPRLTKTKGHLYHESIGDAIQMLNVKLKVKQIGITGW